MNSRWTTAPINRNGQIVTARPNTAGDIDILKTLGAYGLLTADYIAACNGRSYGAVIARLNKLKRKPLTLIRICDTQLNNPRMYQYVRQAFQLSVEGIGKLMEIGFEPKKPKPSKHFVHTLTEAQTAASFDVGARSAGLKHVILERDPIEINGQKLIPDGGPIALGYGDDFYRCILFETDCASEPLTSSNRDRQAIEAKLRAYLKFLDAGYYESYWRLPNCYILFTTTTNVRLQHMIKLLESLNPPREYLKCFGFQVFPTIFAKQPDNKAWAVAQPWGTCTGTLDLSKP